MLKLINVSKKYISPDKVDNPSILNNVNLEIKLGESVAIVGPSGSGKSTLLNIIGTLDNPTSGEILLDNENLAKLSEKNLSLLRNEKIGFIFQMHHLLPQLTVLENVLIPTLVNGNNSEKRAKELLEKVGLSNRLNYRSGQLSGGECQRVAVVRSLVNSPKILLADEPTGSLDSESADKLANLLLELNKEENVALIVVTHSMELAKKMGKIYKIVNGKLIKTE